MARPEPVTGPTAERRLRVVSGEVYADWDAIYQDNVTWLYRLMFAKVGNRADAEDLTAEVFVAALRPLRVSASIGEVRAYLRATARTVLAAHWRHYAGRQVTTIDDDIADRNDAEVPVSDAPAHALAVLDRLPDRYRRILELRFLDARSVREAAAELGVTVTNAKVLQHRALKLAAQLSEEGGR
ncbi:RNA polymerase sigma factor [Rhodococcus spelaei]|uniref:RNA polymerase sigma factor n=1 Tax=Rhodococcus spelaei TaxID=2546320 RepID=A0A541B7K6_9NOCA|nr:RNA polymerase sigma factor [Rhodococcus spelaei]TQF68294.1 RNA polymerase sigma factor [Rhodococcus spelaei]